MSDLLQNITTEEAIVKNIKCKEFVEILKTGEMNYEKQY